MSTSTWTLKNPRGWFAAGAEVQQTLTLLSDGAFKLFVYLCLNARREDGVLQASQTDLARGLKKTAGTIRRSLSEMQAAGVLSYTPFNHNPHGHACIRIAEAFWPYQTRAQPATPPDSADAFVSEVRKMLQARACVQAAFSVADEILARQWLAKGIPLERIEQAILLGCVRKYVSWRNNPAHGLIASLHYFESVLEELDRQKTTPDYLEYLRSRLRRLEQLWEGAHEKPEAGLKESSSPLMPQAR
jgi:hypothetical protein